MNIQPKNNLILINKHKNTQLKVDMTVSSDDSDKRLVTGTVISTGPDVSGFEADQTIIFGKYAVLKLTLKGEDYYFVDSDDVVATCSYTE